VELEFGCRVPWFQKPRPWLKQVCIEGLTGVADFNPPPAATPETRAQNRPAQFADEWMNRAHAWLASQFDALAPKCIPAAIQVRAHDFAVIRHSHRLSVERLVLTAPSDAAGSLIAREVTIKGPKLTNRLPVISGTTQWKDGAFLLSGLDLGNGVRVTNATLSGAHLDKGRLDVDGELTALGGSARGQGSINFANPGLALEVAGSLENMPVAPLAGLLGITGRTDGKVEQANFTFRGDPEDWPSAEMWLAAHATDFRWGRRRWESLEVRGIVVHRRVQVYRLELRQSRNQLSFNGECPLPPSPSAQGTNNAAPWWQAGFSFNVDARLEDLRSFAQLAGEQLPPLAGRMSVNGTLSARAGVPGIDGYLNVEGSAMSIRGVPLDYLHTTLVFKGEEVQAPDLQATHGGDYLSGKGSLRIIGTPRYRYQAELRGSIKDLAIYAPAYQDLPVSPRPVEGAVTFDWSGDGAPGADSGAFKVSMDHFFTQAGPFTLPRPIDLSAEGTYSPESVSFRQFVLRQKDGPKTLDIVKMEGALPWTHDPQALAKGHWIEPSRAMAVRIICTDAPLDLLAAAAPHALEVSAGQVTGWVDASGLPRTPKLDGVAQVKGATFRWTSGGPQIADLDASMRLTDSVLNVDQAKGAMGAGKFQAEGTIDLHDTENPGVDLTIRGQDPSAISSSALSAGIGYTVLWTGDAAKGLTLAGDVQLLDGRWYRRLESTSDFPASVALNWIPAIDWLPQLWAGHQLDIHITAPTPLRLGGDPANGEATPDLQLTGPAQDPRIDGVLTFSHASLGLPSGETGAADGAMYLSGDDPDNPVLSMHVTGDRSETWLYGARSSGMTLSWPGSPAPSDPAFDAPNEMAAFSSPQFTATSPLFLSLH
jgi:phage baseplate assembly protein gpV